MASPTIRESVGNSSGGVTSVNLGSGTAINDVIVVEQAVDFVPALALVAPTVTGVGTWTPIATSQTGSPNIISKSWWAPVTSAGARTLSMSQGGNGSNNLVAVTVYVGADPSVPIDGTPATASGTTGTAQVVGPVVPSTADAVLHGSWAGVQFSGNIDYTAPAGMTERQEQALNNDSALMVATQVLSASGTTGTRSATSSISASSGWVAQLFAIRGIAVVNANDPAPGSMVVSAPAGETVTALPGATVVTDPISTSVTASAPAGETVTAIPAVLADTVTEVVEVVVLPHTAQVHVAAPLVVAEGDVTTHTVQLRANTVAVEGVAEVLTHTVSGRPEVVELVVVVLTHTVSYGNAPVPGLGGLSALPPIPAPRFIVQSILTGEFLSWDLELSDPEVTLVLSGPTAITGTLQPEDPATRELLLSGGFEPWACWIHLEIDGEIRASGILQPYQADGEVLSIEAAGISTYPHGIPYLQILSGIQIDPAEVIRAIWEHLQSYPDGKLGVTVLGSTPIRLGTPEHTEPEIDPDTGQVKLDDDGHPVYRTVEEAPYELLWWDGTDCGSEIDSLVSQGAFDYIERCAWTDESKTSVKHWIEIGFPRIGQRYIDGSGPRFASGENVYNIIPVEEVDDLYASQVLAFGAGEGSEQVVGYAGRPLSRRLRRVAIVQDKTITEQARATAAAASELERRQGLIDVTDMEVDARHPNALFGSYQVGDDVLIDVDVAWFGRLRQYERILSITYDPNGESVRLELRRASAFRYAEGA